MRTELEIFSISIKDYFSSDILKIAILPFIITSIIVYAIFFNMASFGLDHLNEIRIEQNSSIEGNQVKVQEEESIVSSIISYIFKSAAIAWAVNFLVYAIGSFAMIYLSIFISLIVIGFLTPYILSKIRQKHYDNLIFQGDINIFSTVFFLIKTIFIMLILFICLFPFYFIPIIGIIIINLPFYYLFHKLLNFDVSTTIFKNDDIKEFKKKHNKNIRLRTLLLYLLSLLPFFSLFLPVFYIVYIGHGYMNAICSNEQNNDSVNT